MSCSKLEWCRWRRCWYAFKWIVKWMVASAYTYFNVILVFCIDSWNLQTNHSVRWLAWPSIILWNNKLVWCCKDGRSLNVSSIWRMKNSWLLILLRFLHRCKEENICVFAPGSYSKAKPKCSSKVGCKAVQDWCCDLNSCTPVKLKQ